MYTKNRANVNGIIFDTRKITNETLAETSGTTGLKGDKTRFVFRISPNPKANMVVFEADGGVFVAGGGEKALEDFCNSLSFAVQSMKKKMRGKKNERV